MQINQRKTLCCKPNVSLLHQNNGTEIFHQTFSLAFAHAIQLCRVSTGNKLHKVGSNHLFLAIPIFV